MNTIILFWILFVYFLIGFVFYNYALKYMPKQYKISLSFQQDKIIILGFIVGICWLPLLISAVIKLDWKKILEETEIEVERREKHNAIKERLEKANMEMEKLKNEKH